jgi:biopolymer transport protein TolR
MAMAPLGGDDDMVPMADINITPFVDVVLVLLIIFMVAAPLMTASVPVTLPETEAAASTPDDPLVVSVDKDGAVWLKDEKLEDAALQDRLQVLHAAAPDQQVFLHGDRDIAYGRLMAVMEVLRKAGFTKVALATQAVEG